MSDYEEAKSIQQQTADLSSQMDNWKSKRENNGNNQDLVKEAEELADSLRELGREEEANAIHSAAMRAELMDTAESFDHLEDVIDSAQETMSNTASLEVMNTSLKVLQDQLSTAEEIAQAQKDLQGAALDYNLSQASKTNG